MRSPRRRRFERTACAQVRPMATSQIPWTARVQRRRACRSCSSTVATNPTAHSVALPPSHAPSPSPLHPTTPSPHKLSPHLPTPSAPHLPTSSAWHLRSPSSLSLTLFTTNTHTTHRPRPPRPRTPAPCMPLSIPHYFLLSKAVAELISESRGVGLSRRTTARLVNQWGGDGPPTAH